MVRAVKVALGAVAGRDQFETCLPLSVYSFLSQCSAYAPSFLFRSASATLHAPMLRIATRMPRRRVSARACRETAACSLPLGQRPLPLGIPLSAFADRCHVFVRRLGDAFLEALRADCGLHAAA